MKSFLFLAATLFILLAALLLRAKDPGVDELIKKLDSANNADVASATVLLGKQGADAQAATLKLIELMGSKAVVYQWAWSDDPTQFVTDWGAKGFNTFGVGALAADALAKIPNEPLLMLRLLQKSKSTEFKKNGIKVLGAWTKDHLADGGSLPKEVSSHLLQTLKESALSQGDLCSHVCSALEQINDKSNVPGIVTIYREMQTQESPLWNYRRGSVLGALGETNHDNAIELLHEELAALERYDSDPGLASQLIAALARCRDPRSKGTVTKFLEDFDNHVRKDAKVEDWDEADRPSMIEQVYQHNWLDTHRRAIKLAADLKAVSCTPVLISLLDRKEVRRTSALALVKLEDARAIEPLIKIVAMTRSDIDKKKLDELRRQRSVAALGSLLEFARDYEPPNMHSMPVDAAIELDRERLERMTPSPPGKIPADMRGR
jgi:HEAT repeat protein